MAHGSMLGATAFGGENYYALATGWMQSGRSSAVLVRALIGGPVGTWMIEGDLDDWATYYGRFLELMTPGLAEAVRRLQSTIRDVIEE